MFPQSSLVPTLFSMFTEWKYSLKFSTFLLFCICIGIEEKKHKQKPKCHESNGPRRELYSHFCHPSEPIVLAYCYFENKNISLVSLTHAPEHDFQSYCKVCVWKFEKVIFRCRFHKKNCAEYTWITTQIENRTFDRTIPSFCRFGSRKHQFC